MRICTRKLFCSFTGVFGAAAFTCYAAEAHLNPIYGVLAPMFLGHALALLALAILPIPASAAGRLTGYAMILGVLLFCGDILTREFTGHKLFPYAAPMGGSLMILSWFGFFFIAKALKQEFFDKAR